MTTTGTYTSPILSTFPANPLTTTFTAAASSCSGFYSSNGVFVVDPDTACLPSGFASASTDYFSPGLACPAGYVTACHDNAGVASVTTVTCCPYRGDITLGCVTPSTLSDEWATLFCTWIAPADSATTVSLTLSADGTTSTAAVSLSSPGGLNALGVRMVYQSSDLAATATATASGSSSNTGAAATTSGVSTGSGSGSSGGGLSTGATVGIAVALSVAGIAAITGAFLLMRKRRRARPAYGAVGTGSPDPKHHAGSYPAGGYYDPKGAHEVSGVGSAGVTNRQHELTELGAGSPPVELPGNNAWR